MSDGEQPRPSGNWLSRAVRRLIPGGRDRSTAPRSPAPVAGTGTIASAVAPAEMVAEAAPTQAPPAADVEAASDETAPAASVESVATAAAPDATMADAPVGSAPMAPAAEAAAVASGAPATPTTATDVPSGQSSRWAPRPFPPASANEATERAEPPEPPTIVDPLERARAALADARRQMPGMLGEAGEEIALPATVEAPLPPDRMEESGVLAEVRALITALQAERRGLADEVAGLRALVGALREEVQRLAAGQPSVAVHDSQPLPATPSAGDALPVSEPADFAPLAAEVSPETAASAASEVVERDGGDGSAAEPAEVAPPAAYIRASAEPADFAPLDAAPAEAEPTESAAVAERAPTDGVDGTAGLDPLSIAPGEEELPLPEPDEATAPDSSPVMDEATAPESPPETDRATGEPASPAAGLRWQPAAPGDFSWWARPEALDLLEESAFVEMGSVLADRATEPPRERVADLQVEGGAESEVAEDAAMAARAAGDGATGAALGDPESRQSEAVASAPREASPPVEANDTGATDGTPPAYHVALEPGGRPLGVSVGPLHGVRRLSALEQRLAGCHGVERVELASYRGGEASFRVTLESPATVQEVIGSVRGEDLQIAAYSIDPASGALRVRLADAGADGWA